VRLLTDREQVAQRFEDVPESIQALIAARLDTLSPERKSLLQDAAVVGKVFWSGVVAAMGRVDEAGVRVGFHELARKELVRAVRQSSVKEQTEYAFWHALVRDVAYSQIPRPQRIEKHVAAAEWIEAMAGERVTDHAELLAHHYEQALELARTTGASDEALVEPARKFLELAGDRTRSLDVAKAYAFYLRAADLFPQDDLRRGTLLLKALRDRGGPFDEAEARANEALAIFRAAGDEVQEGATLVALAAVVWSQGDTARGQELEVEALEKLERHPPGVELLSAYSRRAGSLSIAGRPEEALRMIDRALALADRLHSDAVAALMYQYRGIARAGLGQQGAIEDIRKGLELALEAGEVITAGIGYSNLASNVLAVSPTDALEIWNDGIDFTAKRGMTTGHFWQLGESTWALFDLGRWDEVVTTATRVVSWAEQYGRLTYAGAIAAPQHALVEIHRGGLAKAAALLDKSLPVAREAGDPQVLVPALAAAAQLAFTQVDLDRALVLVGELETSTHNGVAWYRSIYLPQLVAIAFAADAPDVAAAFLESEYLTTGRAGHALVAARAVAAEQSGEFENALALYQDAATRWKNHPFVLGHAEALHAVGRCLGALGRDPNAPLREARALYTQLGAHPAVERVDDLIARATS
jgi:tetratricopeptide (TPR) repeat protein